MMLSQSGRALSTSAARAGLAGHGVAPSPVGQERRISDDRRPQDRASRSRPHPHGSVGAQQSQVQRLFGAGERDKEG